MRMRALIQRVSGASVEAGGVVRGEIERGLLVFLCVLKGDGTEDVEYVVRKVSGLRVFDDPAGRMNLSVADAGGEVLVVPQFTLAARVRKGNRPSFDDAESPERAEAMFEAFVRGLEGTGLRVKRGVFGERMQVRLTNDGPVTLMIDSRG